MAREIKPFMLGSELDETYTDFTPRPVKADVASESEAPKGEGLTHPSWSGRPVEEKTLKTSSPSEGTPATKPSSPASDATSDKSASTGPKPPAPPTASSADATPKSGKSSGDRSSK